MKFLVIRFSSIGDIVLTTPVVRCLKTQLKDASIHFLIKPQFKSVIVNNPYIDQIHELKENWEEMMRELKEQKFDHIIDLHHNLRTLRVKNDLGIPATSFNKLNFRKLVFVKLKWNVMPHMHIIDRYMETVKQFGVYNDGAGMDYFIPPDEEVEENDIPASHQDGYIAIVIGASFYTKKMPVYKLRELCAQINHPVILLGAREEFADGQ